MFEKLPSKNQAYFALGLIVCVSMASWIMAGGTIPTFGQVKSTWQPSQAYLLDRQGNPIQELRMDYRHRRGAWIALSQISPALVHVVTEAEDRHFRTHHGVDYAALAASGWQRMMRNSRRGGSTISMQLTALLDDGLNARKGSRSFRQKWAQMREAVALERTWSKDEILEAYLNLVSYRGEIQGIDATARTLFDKSPAGLNDAESLLLAALLPSPNAETKRVAARACTLAKAQLSHSDCAEIEDLTQRALMAASSSGVLAGQARELAVKMLDQPGQRVTSTLDGALQVRVSDILRAQMHSLADLSVRDGAVLVVDNASGEVLAYVGNTGNDSSARFVDGIRALRQAGSTLKPFLYELAIERRLLTAASILDDSPLQMATPAGIYLPRDYEQDSSGPVSLRTALASSLNLPAVRTLALVGLTPFHSRLSALGYSLSQAPDYYGFALALGSADVSLWDQVNAYRTLANGGTYGPLSLKLHEATSPVRQVMAADAAYIVADILADRNARSLTFGLENPLATRYWTAVKTGTSKDMRDNWCIGFSRRYTVGVWVGNFDGSPMHDVSGITGAAPVWMEVMNLLHESVPSDAPQSTSGVVQTSVKFPGGLEPSRAEYFLAGTESAEIQIAPDADRPARIAYPTEGMLIALDPDIPPALQAVFFQARHAGMGLRWVLDGTPVGTGHKVYRWTPIAGSHDLALVDDMGRSQDRLRFSVRGSVVR